LYQAPKKKSSKAKAKVKAKSDDEVKVESDGETSDSAKSEDCQQLGACICSCVHEALDLLGVSDIQE
jgi:hypothetical protein